MIQGEKEMYYRRINRKKIFFSTVWLPKGSGGANYGRIEINDWNNFSTKTATI